MESLGSLSALGSSELGIIDFSVYIGGTGTLYLTYVPGECQTLTFIVFQLQLVGLAL